MILTSYDKTYLKLKEKTPTSGGYKFADESRRYYCKCKPQPSCWPEDCPSCGRRLRV